MIFEKNFIKKFEKCLNENVKLSSYSWFNLGGNADYLFKPRDINHLKEFLKEANKKNLKITILGAGSNTLFRDNGVRGVVIKLGKEFSFIKKIEENVLEIGAATLDRKVANFAMANSLKNLEFLSCIPGSIGGAIIMNSGCYDSDISKFIISIKVLDKKKMIESEIKKEDIKFFYRGTDLSNDFIILSAKLKCSSGDKNEIEKVQNELIERKKISQPSQIKTCGSTFKNINGDKKAWMLIKEAGCNNYSEGDAVISKKHCNFFVNNGKARSRDIENLVKKCKKKYLKKLE
jgi:UDP-N-acetylmuramate dehydrogenase